MGKTHGERINTMICDIIANSQGKNDVVMSSECQTYMDKLRAFMFERVYYNSEAKREDHKVLDIISILYEKFTKKPQLLPSDAGIDLKPATFPGWYATILPACPTGMQYIFLTTFVSQNRGKSCNLHNLRKFGNAMANINLKEKEGISLNMSN